MKRKVTKAQQRAVEAKRKRVEQIAFSIYEPKLKRFRLKALKVLFDSLRDTPIEKIPKASYDRLRETYLQRLLTDMAAQIGGDGALRVEKDFAHVQAKSEKRIWEQRVRKWYSSTSGDRIVSIEETFRNTVQNKLRDTLELLPNAGVEQQTDFLFNEVISDLKMEKWQVRLIIQTEALADLAAGEWMAMNDLGLDLMKMWVAAFNNTRPAHAAMHGVTIPMNDYFKMPNGDKMYGPHDMINGSSENVINCSCGLIYANK